MIDVYCLGLGILSWNLGNYLISRLLIPISKFNDSRWLSEKGQGSNDTLKFWV